MGIVAYLGELPAITDAWTDWVLIIIILGIIHQSLPFDDQLEIGFNLDCILFYWSEDPQARSTFFWLLWAEWQDSVAVLNTHASDSVYDDNYWPFSLSYLEPHCHFKAQQYPTMLTDCFIWCLIKQYQSCIQLLMATLCCIGANKVVHVCEKSDHVWFLSVGTW